MTIRGLLLQYVGNYYAWLLCTFESGSVFGVVLPKPLDARTHILLLPFVGLAALLFKAKCFRGKKPDCRMAAIPFPHASNTVRACAEFQPPTMNVHLHRN
jgi:hypothetical protein